MAPGPGVMKHLHLTNLPFLTSAFNLVRKCSLVRRKVLHETDSSGPLS